MTILSSYILFGRGRKRSHPIFIGCRTLDSVISLVQNPVIWLVGTIKHFNPLLCQINSFFVPHECACAHPTLPGEALRVTFEWIFRICIRKSTDILNVKRGDVWKKHGKLFWWHHTTNWYFKRQTSGRLKKAWETVFMSFFFNVR